MFVDSAADCKQSVPSPGRFSVIRIARLHGSVLLGLFAILVVAPSPARAQPDASKNDLSKQAVPELSLESIYHPKQKFNYFTATPTTHWLRSPDTLLIRRDQTWKEVNLQSFDEQPWPAVDQLAKQIQALDGVDKEQALKSANSAVTQMETASDPVLIRIKTSLAIVSLDEPARWLSRDASLWRDATIDPTGNRIAYTNNGDLFVLDIQSERSLQLTHDASATLLDGILDWTYQEEIYGRGNFRGFWFSPDGQWMAMLRIDISGIEPYTLSSATGERGTGIIDRYPKAGDPIPHAELLLWDLRGLDDGAVPSPQSLAKSTPQLERIITGVWWKPEELELMYAVSDRVQSWREVHVLRADPMAGMQTGSTVVLREESPTWVEPPAEPVWLADGSVLWQSEVPSGRTRLYHISSSGMVVTPVTPADFDVRDFFVHGSSLVVTGDAESETIEQHAYQIDISQGAKSELKPMTTLTGWHSVDLSPSHDWLIDRFSSYSQPTEVWLRSLDGTVEQCLAKAESKLTGGWIEPEPFRIEAEDGTSLKAMLIRPATATKQKPCPVVIDTYGGPSAPTVRDRFAGSRGLYRELLARQGIATLMVDNRSSAGAGLADTWTIHQRVGEQEFQDVMSAVGWLKEQPWVDDQKLAIRGWSFGGFLTLFCMTHSDAFAAGVAGGSVTDWKEYDAFYTERYMGLPQENPEGYEKTAPVYRADQLHGRVLLIHGESDDNVHPSNTMRMAAELQKAGKEFDLMIYPGAKHGVREPRQVWHLNLTIDRFLKKTLTP